MICDGTAYDKSAYPELSEHLLSLSDTTPYVVDGDETKFKVPDLRGEFLRGTGINSHTNQGSGANVGVHQDGTELPDLWFDDVEGQNNYIYLHIGHNRGSAGFQNVDSEVIGDGTQRYWGGTKDSHSFSNWRLYTTARPTNTSVLYCIKY